jgi:transcriptional regulator with XRE-family HTH domain
MTNTIAEELRNFREDLGLTQQQFASKVGITQVAVSQYENFKRLPSTLVLKRISQTYPELIKEILIGANGPIVADPELRSAFNHLLDVLVEKKVSVKKIRALVRYLQAE